MADFFQDDPNDPFYNPNAAAKKPQQQPAAAAAAPSPQPAMSQSTSFNWSDTSKYQSLLSDLSTQPSAMPSMMSQKQATMYSQQQQQQQQMLYNQQMLFYQQQQQQQAQQNLFGQSNDFFGQSQPQQTITPAVTAAKQPEISLSMSSAAIPSSNNNDFFGVNTTTTATTATAATAFPATGNVSLSPSLAAQPSKQQQQQQQDFFGQSTTPIIPTTTTTTTATATSSGSSFFDVQPTTPPPPAISLSQSIQPSPRLSKTPTADNNSNNNNTNNFFTTPSPRRDATAPIQASAAVVVGGSSVPTPPQTPLSPSPTAMATEPLQSPKQPQPRQLPQVQKPQPRPPVATAGGGGNNPFVVSAAPKKRVQLPKMNPFSDEFYAEFSKTYKQQQQQQQQQSQEVQQKPIPLPQPKPQPQKQAEQSSFFGDSMPALKPAVPSKSMPQPPQKQAEQSSFFDDPKPAQKHAVPSKPMPKPPPKQAEQHSFFDESMPALKPVVPSKSMPQPPQKKADQSSFFDDPKPAQKHAVPSKPMPQPPQKQADQSSFFGESMPALKPAVPSKPMPQPPQKQTDQSSFFDDTMPALKPAVPSKPMPQPPQKQAEQPSFFDESLPALKPVDSPSQSSPQLSSPKAKGSLPVPPPKKGTMRMKAIPNVPEKASEKKIVAEEGKQQPPLPPPVPKKPDMFDLTPKEKVDFTFNSPQLSGSVSTTKQTPQTTATEAPSNDFFSESSQFPPMKPAEADAPPPPIPAKPKPKSSLPPTPADAAAAPTDFFAASVMEPEKKEVPMTPKSKPGVALPGLTGISASTQIKASTSTETPSNDFFSESSQFPPMKPAEADAPPPPIPAKPKPKSSLPPTPVDAAAAPTDFFAASAVEPEKKEIPMTPKSKPGVALPGLAAVGVSAEVKAEVPMEDSEWDVSITADELAEYRRMFRGCKTNEAGKIGGGDVKRLWMQKRRNSDLKEIYILAKRDRSDKKAELSEVEFIMGLYIISRRNAGAPLPRIVTETEWLRLDAILAEDDAKASASAATSEVVMPPMREAPMPPMPPMPPMAEKPIVAAAAPEEDKAEDVPPRLPPKPSTPSGDLLLLGNNGGNSNGSDSEQQQPPQLPPLPPKISLELPMQPPAVPAPEVPLSERKAAGEEGSGNDGDDDDDDDAGDAPQLPARPTKVAVPPTLVVPPTVKAAPPATPPTLTIPGKEPTEHQEEGEEEGDAPPMPPKPQNMLAAPLTVDSEDVDFELAPSLPPRSRPRATDLGAWMKEYKIDPSVQEVFLAKGVKVSALLGLTEESLTALGVHRLRKRLDVYYAVWLSRKELSDKHHHSHRSHTDKSSSGSTAAAAAAAGGGGGSGAAGSGRKSRKEALKPRGRQSRSRSFAAPDDQRAPPNLSVPTDDSAAAAAAAERRRKDEKKRRQQSRAIRRQLSDNEGSDSSDSDNNSSKSFSDNETPIPELTMTVPSASAAGGEQPMAETRRSRSPSPTAPAPKQHIRGRKRGGAFSRRAGPGGAGGTGLAKPSGPSVAPPPKLVITPGRTLDERKTRTQEEAARESAELMHALFVAGQVRMFFLETYGPRRRVAESILTELRDYVAKVKKYAFALKTTKDGGGFSDEEYTLFTPLVETAGVPDEVSSALGARFAAWNKLTTTSDCFNKCFGLWMQKFGEWFIHRGRNIYAIEKCTARSKKFKNSIKACEEMGGSQDSPVPIGTFYEYPTKFMTSLCMLFTQLKDCTPPGHPDCNGIDTLLLNLTKICQADNVVRVKENKTRTELEKLEPISHKISSCPKDFIKDGEVYQLKVGKKPTKRGFMLFNDMLILGEKKSKKLNAKIIVDFDVATISDIPDGTAFGDEKIRDAWAVYDPTPIILFAPDGPDQKGALFNLMQSTLEGYKSDLIRKREKQANLVSTGFKIM